MTSPLPSLPKVFVTRRLPSGIEARFTDLFQAHLRKDDAPLSQDHIKAAVKDCDVLVPTVTDTIDADIINHAGPQLRLIANFGAGTDHIDVEAAHAKGIIVTNTPGVLTEDTADLTLALILALPRRLVEADALARRGEFTGWAPTGLLGTRVRGKALGIIGMGRIGQAVARRASAVGLRVHYHNRRPVPQAIENTLGATFHEDLDAMLGQIDILSINCPRTPATYHMIDAARLAALPKPIFIVNTSRGDVIDEAALVKALQAGTVAGAALDVYEHEPDIHPGLPPLPNVILAPHIGSATFESREEMGQKVLINIREMMDGHTCPDRVLPPRPDRARAL